jgi:hypothetical protein
MGQITHGVVKYSRTLNLGDYNSKKADVEIGFQVAEGESHDKMLNLASSIAVNKAEEILTGKAAPAAAASVGPVGGGNAVMSDDDKKRLAAADAAAKKKAKEDAAAAAKTAKAAKAPPAVDDDFGDEPTGTGAAPAAGDEDLNDLLGDDVTATAPPVTDKDLLEAVQKKNGEIKSAPAIRNLLGKYVAAPGQLKDIPAEKRAAFLAELKTLKAAA